MLQTSILNIGERAELSRKMGTPLEEYNEYDDPLKRREIRSQYRDLMDKTKSMEYTLFSL